MKFNYCIGYYYDDSGRVEVYRHIMGREVFYGDDNHANELLEEARASNSYRDWQIFVLRICQK